MHQNLIHRASNFMKDDEKLVVDVYIFEHYLLLRRGDNTNYKLIVIIQLDKEEVNISQAIYLSFDDELMTLQYKIKETLQRFHWNQI